MHKLFYILFLNVVQFFDYFTLSFTKYILGSEFSPISFNLVIDKVTLFVSHFTNSSKYTSVDNIEI